VAIPTRTLGRTGAEVTVLGYGAMELRGEPRGPALEDADAGRLLDAVLDEGITLIDTSIDYGRSEELIGRYLSSRRDEYFLASKCGCLLTTPADATPPYPHDYTAANVQAGVEQSLRRLQTDHLDLVQVHMSPSREQLESDGTVEELVSLRDEGKVRFLGGQGVERASAERRRCARRGDLAGRRARRAARGRHEPSRVHPALHAQPPGPVEHNRRDEQPRSPAR
jgi:aryl-alcohol dehydrogenase-like predicted oxidoreductase